MLGLGLSVTHLAVLGVAPGSGDGETFFVLLEDGNTLLLESNDIILLEAAS